MVILKVSALPDKLITQPKKVLPLCENKLSLGNAGNISLSANTGSFIDGAQIISLSTHGTFLPATGNAGSMTINAKDSITITGLSFLDLASENKNGENFIITINKNDNDISANAIMGRGGNIIIQSGGLFSITGRGSIPPQPLLEDSNIQNSAYDSSVFYVNEGKLYSHGSNINSELGNIVIKPRTAELGTIIAQPEKIEYFGGSSTWMPIHLNSNARNSNPSIEQSELPVEQPEFTIVQPMFNVNTKNSFGTNIFERSTGNRKISPNEKISIAEITQTKHTYVVVIPITNNKTLAEVRKFIPTAFAAKSSSGNYVNAGTYHERSLADSLAQLLRTRGINAKVETF